MTYTRQFSELGKEDVTIAGGKGASLGEMAQAGISVPPGFVVTAQAFDELLKITDLNVELDSILDNVDHAVMHTVEEASEKIKALIISAAMPTQIADEIRRSFGDLGAKYVAVRSSATSEDSADAAWAGQLESYLNTTEEKLLENVKKCWASLFTPRAIFYRFEKGLHGKPISVAVVIQKMVESEVSGIAFSVHPVTQDYDQLIIEAGFGLGEAIVSGSITPDSYVVEKSAEKILDKNITTQERGLFRKEDGGNEWQDIPTNKGEQPTLTDEEVIELAQLVVKIEKHYGFPIDVEWAREGGQFYIVQSRPITTLAPRTEKSHEKERSALPDIADYQRLFQFDGFVPFVVSYEFTQAYVDLGGLTCGDKKLWISFMSKSALKKTLQDGLELYKSTGKYQTYRKELYQTFESISEKSASLQQTSTLTKEQAGGYLSLLRRYRILYQKTEFFYTDCAFEKKDEFSEITKNFESFDQFKLDGRKYLNDLYFIPDSHFNSFLRKIAAQFSVPNEELLHYSVGELLTLFDGLKVSKEILKARNESYVIFAKSGEMKSVAGEEAAHFIEGVRSQTQNVKTLKGQVANKGKVTATAKVIKVNLSEYDKLASFIDEMEKGQVLIAETTEPSIIAACKKASAIVTNQGGMMSHAAIVSREMGIPCVVGTAVATEVINDGDLIEVNADKGIVKILKRQP